jgi:YD repeat-containing protein
MRCSSVRGSLVSHQKMATISRRETLLSNRGRPPKLDCSCVAHRNSRDFITGLTVSDAANVSIETFGYTLNALGQRTLIDEGNGRVVQFQRDALSLLTQERSEGVSPSSSGVIEYTHNAVGYRTERTSTQPSVPNQAFTLNANGELNGVTYDANGNPTASNGDTDVFDFDPGRLAGASGDSCRLAEGRDERGARTSQNRLIRRTKPDGTVIDYVYDAYGQRVKKGRKQVAALSLRGTLRSSQAGRRRLCRRTRCRCARFSSALRQSVPD